jgi:hypothetical protein
LQDYFRHFKDYGTLPLSSTTTENEINILAKNVDDLIFSFDESVTKNSLVISKEILGRLNGLSLKLFGTDIPNAASSKVWETVNTLDDYIAELIIDANDINELMRKDLNVDELNLSLYRRMKRN